MRAQTRTGGRPFRRWTDEQDKRLCELWRAGASVLAMATTLDRSQSAIVSRADFLRDERGIDLPLRNPAGRVPV